MSRRPAVIVRVAHLDDDERALLLGVVLEEVLNRVRSLPGTQRLGALCVFDEVYGFLPPHPANPPTKRPLVALMKQARAFSVRDVHADGEPFLLQPRRPMSLLRGPMTRRELETAQRDWSAAAGVAPLAEAR